MNELQAFTTIFSFFTVRFVLPALVIYLSVRFVNQYLSSEENNINIAH